MYEYNEATHHVGATIYSGNASNHPKMTDQEWEDHLAELSAAHDLQHSQEAINARVEKIVRSWDDMKREYEENDGMVGRGNLYLPEGVTRGYDVNVHGPVEFIN